MPFSVLRDPRDRTTVALSLLPWLAVAALPSPATIAIAIWWLGNTVAHQAVHRRLFVRIAAERAFSLWLTAGLGVPQRLWRRRHLAHHAGRRPRWRSDRWLAIEGALLLALHGGLVAAAPAAWATVYLPGLGGGLLLAAVHGWQEHARGTTSCCLRWWNALMLRDGLHEAHHADPARPWWALSAARATRVSKLPPPVRWIACFSPANALDAAERLVLRWPWLQRRVLAAHRRAIAAVFADEPAPARIVVVGGGLFPRSAILLRERFPRAEIHVLEAEAAHLAAAATRLPAGVVARVGVLVQGMRLDADLVVLPLALRGERGAFLASPPAPRVLVHDWLVRRPGRGAVVAWWLAKRVYLVHANVAAAALPVTA